MSVNTKLYKLYKNMATWNSAEIQILLKLVQEREALYDVANEDYTNRDIVWALWTDIARQLNKTPNACRDKWTSLRCVYRRIVSQQASSKTKKKIKWPWAHMMGFLIPHLKTFQPRYGPDVEIDDADSVITISDYKPYGESTNNFMSVNNFSEEFELDETMANSEDGVAEYLYYESGAESDQVEEPTVSKPPLKRIKLDDTSSVTSRTKTNIRSRPNTKDQTESEEEYLNVLSARYYQPAREMNVPVHHQDHLAGADADEMFFRSIVPDVKLLNRKDKGTFKLKVQQLLYDMLYSSKDSETQVGTSE